MSRARLMRLTIAATFALSIVSSAAAQDAARLTTRYTAQRYFLDLTALEPGSLIGFVQLPAGFDRSILPDGYATVAAGASLLPQFSRATATGEYHVNFPMSMVGSGIEWAVYVMESTGLNFLGTTMPNPVLLVIPTGTAAIGPDTDFDPTNLHRTYVLTNRRQAAVQWEMRLSQPWLSTAGPASGNLLPGQSTGVSVDVDPFAAERGRAEPAVASIDFLDHATGAALVTRSVTVQSSFTGLGSGGWTTFPRSADTRMVFVSSSSGNDAADGLSLQTARRTIAAGKALLRHGYPDWLLLKRGDVWQENLGQWKMSGRSASAPMVVAAYGNAAARPLLRTGSTGGVWTSGSGGSPPTIDNLAFFGLHFQADTYAGGGDCVGAQLLQPGSHVLIENCAFEGYSGNLVFQGWGGRHHDFKLRRSVIVDAYAIHAIGGHSQGLYAYGVDGLLIEENVFDHNGWNAAVPGAGADIYSHNLYIDNDNTGVVVRGNIIANGSSHGMQLRPGGSAVNNLFIRNSIALSLGGGNNPEPGGVTADVLGNVILDGKNIDAANPRGWGMYFANIAGGRVRFNVIANNTLGAQPSCLTLDGIHQGDTRPSIGVHDLRMEENILYNWGGGFNVLGDSAQVTNIDLLGNDLQNPGVPGPLLAHVTAISTEAFDSAGNRFFCPQPASAWFVLAGAPQSLDSWKALVGDTTSVAQPVAYPDPGRSVASYNALLGGPATLDAFLAEARQQSKAHWRADYMAVRLNRYVRQGF